MATTYHKVAYLVVTGWAAGWAAACGSSSDSASGGGDGKTDPAKTVDGTKDGNETDVDCGGGIAPACIDGKSCNADTDCTSALCSTSKTCAAPSATDGRKNGDETDVDCGGTSTSAPKCAEGKGCLTFDDCATEACSYKNTCITEKSCAPHEGGDTCGPADAQESCCKTLPVGGVMLEKYSITAGRMRQFIERVNGDLRGWVQAHRTPELPAAWDQYLPTMLDSGTADVDFTGAYQELGPFVHGDDDGGNEGCYIKGNGARTYRLPDDVNARFGDPQAYDQKLLDQKPMNCATLYTYAAFCAWEGGRLPTRADLEAAWGNKKYPWGDSPPPAGWSTAYDSDATGFATTPASGGDLKRANYFYNFWDPPAKVGSDYSVYIAEPGRFPTGNSASGHADIAGNVFNMTRDTNSAGNFFLSRSGSWQGHKIPYTAVGANSTFRGQNKYWAIGARCVF